MKKIDLAKARINENIEIFKCPKCGESMKLGESNSLMCADGHCFDLSKNGYVNLLLSSVKTEYDKEMLESRNIICREGFFSHMIDGISSLLAKWVVDFGTGSMKVLDVGCGEGSHLSDIINHLKAGTKIEFQGVGIDISKEGIQIAAREYPDFIWCVADLARNPFRDGQFDIILNIFSPSNYSEFNRIGTENGILLKVVPGSGYLKELRSAFYEETDKESYSNERVVKHFSDNYELLDELRISYTVKVGKENLEHLIRMTPLSWSAGEERVQRVLESGIDEITVDVFVMLGRRK